MGLFNFGKKKPVGEMPLPPMPELPDSEMSLPPLPESNDAKASGSLMVDLPAPPTPIAVPENKPFPLPKPQSTPTDLPLPPAPVDLDQHMDLPELPPIPEADTGLSVPKPTLNVKEDAQVIDDRNEDALPEISDSQEIPDLGSLNLPDFTDSILDSSLDGFDHPLLSKSVKSQVREVPRSETKPLIHHKHTCKYIELGKVLLVNEQVNSAKNDLEKIHMIASSLVSEEQPRDTKLLETFKSEVSAAIKLSSKVDALLFKGG